MRAELLKGAGGSASLKAINIALTLGSGVLLARALGPENYGIYAFVLSLITLLGLPAKAGLPTLLVRETAKNQLNKNWGLIRGLLRFGNIFVSGYSFAMAMVVGFIVWLKWGGVENAQVHTFLWALLLLPLISFEGLRAGALRGLRWVISAQLPEQIVRPLVMITLLGVALLLGKEVTSITAIQLNALATLLTFAVGAYLLLKALPDNVKQAKPEYMVRSWVTSLLPLSLFSGLSVLDSQISIVILGFWGLTEEAGLFRVAATGATFVSFGLTAVNMALAPQIARLYNAGETEKLQRMITLSTWAVTAVSVPVVFVYFFWGEELVSFVFGEAYASASAALIILSIGQFVNSSSGSVALILNMTGNDRKTLPAVCTALIINIAISLALVPAYGFIGVAIGYSVSLVVWNLMMVWMVRKHTGINAWIGGGYAAKR